jgi:hypothetical protein
MTTEPAKKKTLQNWGDENSAFFKLFANCKSKYWYFMTIYTLKEGLENWLWKTKN